MLRNDFVNALKLKAVLVVGVFAYYRFDLNLERVVSSVFFQRYISS